MKNVVARRSPHWVRGDQRFVIRLSWTGYTRPNGDGYGHGKVAFLFARAQFLAFTTTRVNRHTVRLLSAASWTNPSFLDPRQRLRLIPNMWPAAKRRSRARLCKPSKDGPLIRCLCRGRPGFRFLAKSLFTTREANLRFHHDCQ